MKAKRLLTALLASIMFVASLVGNFRITEVVFDDGTKWINPSETGFDGVKKKVATSSEYVNSIRGLPRHSSWQDKNKFALRIFSRSIAAYQSKGIIDSLGDCTHTD